jgi:hypothetical protein
VFGDLNVDEDAEIVADWEKMADEIARLCVGGD